MGYKGRIGVEIELMAPRGSSRQTLAAAIAHSINGTIHRRFHPQSEPSQIPGTPILENLTLGFEVRNPHGQVVVTCVDDLTLQADCDRTHPPQAGWYRIVSDDIRLLRLIQRHSDPESPIEQVLAPIGALFGTSPEPGAGGMIRLADQVGPPIAIAAPLPGERERPCELVTAPFKLHELDKLGDYLAIARQLQFFAPKEGATHLHFDAAPLRHPQVFRNLVYLLWTYGPALKQQWQTNPHCQRLGPWPDELLTIVQADDWNELSWTEAQTRLSKLTFTKYCDFNLKHVISDRPLIHTFEVRVLPVWLTPEPLLEAIALMQKVIERAIAPQPVSFQPPLPLYEPSLLLTLTNIQ
ncbi:MAG: amidoligase enzyme [Cyanothece sp. SIO2G6]|nr:amidoligase enzyme [Cyanothece sp. SIO2G6]